MDHETPQSDPLLTDLTESQHQAVTHVQGPLLVLAAAGSGKTRVITRRIANLVLRVGVAPWHVLAITFTNKAAAEMRSRIEQLMTPRQAKAVTVCTFHGLCARLIGEFASRLELPQAYSIYSTSDQTRAMKQALEELHISTSNFPPGRVLSTVSNAKNQLLTPDAYAESATDFYSRTVSQIYIKYQAIMNKNHALDFDDLLLRTVTLFKHHPDVLTQLRDRFQYVLIDEYQDTNHAQFVLAHALSAEHCNICATGDPDQSIYGWRGADIRNILDFESQFPNVKTVRLEQNYRSTKSILAVADHLIQHNTERKHKALWTDNADGQPIQTITCHDERHETQWVIDWLRQLRHQQSIPWRDMAIFYRVNSLSRVMEDGLRNASIPYQIARGTSFYERREIKDAIAYLRVTANAADEVNLQRIINIPPRGISHTTVRALQAYAADHQKGLFDAMVDVAKVTGLNKRASAAVSRFTKTLQGWRSAAEFERTSEPLEDDLNNPEVSSSSGVESLRMLVEQILRESGLEEHFRFDKSDPEHERLMNLGELVSSAGQFEEEFESSQPDERPRSIAEKLAAYLQQISLVSDVDGLDNEQGAVNLMTLHAAKGLEFPVVAMIGMEDGLLPHAESNSDLQKLEEERRLCFVGVTRCQSHLALTHTRVRTIFGRIQPAIPSRFLEEMPDDYMQEDSLADPDVALEGDRSIEQVDGGEPDSQEDGDELRAGTLVRHPKFGLGRIMDIRAGGAQTRARIEFNTSGTKTLVLQYAPLEKVSV